jgi:lysylphosphatidylglycerol synthetase-like protein (DUF2156 family)
VEKKRKMIQQDSRSVHAYILSIVGLVLSLFIPFAYIVLRLFQPLVAALLLGVIIPLIALILGIMGLVKSKQSGSFKKSTKVLSIITIIISIILIAFSVYAFIKSGGLA